MLKKRKVARSEGVELPNGRKLQSLKEEGEVYKYVGVLEADDIKHESMIKRLSKTKSIRIVKKVLRSTT